MGSHDVSLIVAQERSVAFKQAWFRHKIHASRDRSNETVSLVQEGFLQTLERLQLLKGSSKAEQRPAGRGSEISFREICASFRHSFIP